MAPFVGLITTAFLHGSRPKRHNGKEELQNSLAQSVVGQPAKFLRWIHISALSISILGFVWTLALIAFGGFDFHLLGARIRSNDPFRPLLAAAIALTIHIITASDDVRWVARVRRIDERWLVSGLALSTAGVGVVYSTTVAGGADAYGYVSQADQWIRGTLRLPQPWVAQLPWPSADWTASPLGYKPSDDWNIVPTYSPGFPMLMAAAKLVAGHGAMFWIVPLCGAGLVLATYGLGQRLGSSGAGLIGAWLTVTSAPFVNALILPWSDVPASAAWVAAFYFLFGDTRWAAGAAGLASATAILIRPNLAWGAAVVGLWFLLRARHEVARQRFRIAVNGVIFGVTAGLGILAVSLIYQHLYGSPVESGYGRFSDNFHFSRLGANLLKYAGWLVETHSAVALLGIVAVLLPGRRVWPGVLDRARFIPLGAFILGVWLMYGSYLVFDHWSYLRFLLPAYPLAMIGVGAVVIALVRSRGPGIGLAILGAILVLGVFVQFKMAVKSGTLSLSQTERRYVVAGRLAQSTIDENSAIFSLTHSGSARYYGGRVTLRYDLLEPAWLDRAVEWLSAHGVHPYLLGDEYEIAEFQRRFAGQRTVAYTQSSPVFTYEGPGRVALFDLQRERTEPTLRIVGADAQSRSARPAPAPVLVLK